MDELVKLVRKSPDPLSKRTMRDLMGDSRSAREAIERAILEGRLVERGRAHGHPTYASAAEVVED